MDGWVQKESLEPDKITRMFLFTSPYQKMEVLILFLKMFTLFLIDQVVH